MDLGLSDDQEQLVASVARLCAREVTTERVRDAEPAGFDSALWQSLASLGAPGMGAPAAVGGGGASLLDLALVTEVLGGALAPAPLSEHVVATRVLARTLPANDPLVASLVAGEVVGAVAPVRAVEGVARTVPAGGVATAVVALDDDALVLVEQEPPGVIVPNLGASPVAHVPLRGAGRRVLADGIRAAEEWARMVDEWRVLTAAALVGLADAALRLGVEYAKVRRQFGVPIGSFQAIAHGLADAAAAVDGGRLLAREAAWVAVEEPVSAHALAAMAFVFCGQTAQQAARVSLHTHGGYGFMLEYDVQLYYRRAKAWALLGGDPRRAVGDLGDALFGPAAAGAGAA